MHGKTITFGAGIVLGIVAGFSSLYATEVALTALILFVLQLSIYLFERKKKSIGFLFSLYTILFALGLVVGILRVQFLEEKTPFVCEVSCTYDARIVSSPETKDVYQTVVVRPLENTNDMYDVQLRLPLYPRFERGETVRVSGKVTVPGVIAPHGEKKSFDYAAYLHTKDVGSEMMFPKVEVLDTEAHTVPDHLGRWKEDLVVRTNTFVSSPASTLATGMLFGNSSMSQELKDTFRAAGLSHIVVLSGFNIAIVITSILFVFAFLPLFLRIALASLCVIIFVTMVGGEASVVRATLMAFVALLATLVGRAYVAKQALTLSLLSIILYEPHALLHDVSLHLSFLATAGIVYASEPLKNLLERKITSPTFVELLTTTLAAYFATLPYVMYTFGTVSIYALLANMIVLPFVPFAMLLSFIVVVLSYMSNTLALVVGYMDTLLLDLILFIASIVTRLPYASLQVTLPFVGMILLYTLLGLSLIYVVRRKNETPVTTPDGHLTDTISY